MKPTVTFVLEKHRKLGLTKRKHLRTNIVNPPQQTQQHTYSVRIAGRDGYLIERVKLRDARRCIQENMRDGYLYVATQAWDGRTSMWHKGRWRRLSKPRRRKRT